MRVQQDEVAQPVGAVADLLGDRHAALLRPLVDGVHVVDDDADVDAAAGRQGEMPSRLSCAISSAAAPSFTTANVACPLPSMFPRSMRSSSKPSESV